MQQSAALPKQESCTKVQKKEVMYTRLYTAESWSSTDKDVAENTNWTENRKEKDTDTVLPADNSIVTVEMQFVQAAVRNKGSKTLLFVAHANLF